jgi:transposase
MDPDSDRGPESRAQVSFGSLDEMIPAEHQVRFLDAFVDKLDLAKLQFNVKPLNKEGRPPFHPSLFLKIYLYGYHNGVRSSRGLEKESSRNIEMQWLCGKLVPSYHSIADFRKENHKALRNMFKLYVQFLQHLKLIMLVYNMKRTMSLLTMPDLLKKLSAWKPNYKRLHRFFTKWLDLNEIWAMLTFEKHQQVQIFALAKTHLIQR